MYKKVFSAFAGILFLAAVSAMPAAAQRDYFTPEEIEIIRDAQQIDERIAVLVKAMDRRFEVMNVNVSPPKEAKKKSGDWGPMPTGTKSELIRDIRRIMQKAIDDIDNLSERPNSAVIEESSKKKGETMSKLFPKAVRELAAAAARYRPALAAEIDRSSSADDIAQLSATMEMCDEVIASLSKLPPPSK
ncbi:MAG: hypothetical protein IPM50_03510 [Acidobacteriota bacterium]|nr:MAG: hypothetical protein IPM50_03510 [Acidobacteriota bacterium]